MYCCSSLNGDAVGAPPEESFVPLAGEGVVAEADGIALGAFMFPRGLAGVCITPLPYRRPRPICYTLSWVAGKACQCSDWPAQSEKFPENEMTTMPKESPTPPSANSPNVVQRLAQAIGTAKEMGFDVRKVVLDDQTPGWCQIGEKKILFLDLTATTGEQLDQIDQIIASYCNQKFERQSEKIAA